MERSRGYGKEGGRYHNSQMSARARFPWAGSILQKGHSRHINQGRAIDLTAKQFSSKNKKYNRNPYELPLPAGAHPSL